MWATVWKLKTVQESNDKGSWFNYSISQLDIKDVPSAALQGIGLYEMFRKARSKRPPERRRMNAASSQQDDEEIILTIRTIRCFRGALGETGRLSLGLRITSLHPLPYPTLPCGGWHQQLGRKVHGRF